MPSMQWCKHNARTRIHAHEFSVCTLCRQDMQMCVLELRGAALGPPAVGFQAMHDHAQIKGKDLYGISGYRRVWRKLVKRTGRGGGHFFLGTPGSPSGREAGNVEGSSSRSLASCIHTATLDTHACALHFVCAACAACAQHVRSMCITVLYVTMYTPRSLHVTLYDLGIPLSSLS